MLCSRNEISSKKHMPSAERPLDDGDLTDLLSELRVLLPSSQLLSAFLITVPFMPGFESIAHAEKWVFLVTFVLAIVSLILLSAPAVQHRLIRPLKNRPRFKRIASLHIIAGAILLGSALVSGAQLVLSTVFGHWVGTGVAGAIALVMALLWWVLPQRLARSGRI